MKKFITYLKNKNILIYDKFLLKYFLNIDISVGERFIGLLIHQNEYVLILNRLFETVVSKELKIIYYEDGDNYIEIIKKIIKNEELYIDDNLPSKFLFKLINHDINCLNGYSLINDFIMIKSDDDILKMKKSSEINDKVMQEVKNFLKVGISEIEVSNFIYQSFEKYGVKPSFEPIVAFGSNCADPHCVPSERKLKTKESIIIDMGCIYQGFCSDMTRTFFIEENNLKEIYNIVFEALKLAKKKIKIGIKLSELDKVARDYINLKGYGKYFNHRLGHGCGIMIHEPYEVSKDSDITIKEGMIFSIEPGIYIENIGGVRIEDLVLITKDSYLSLNNFSYDEVIK